MHGVGALFLVTWLFVVGSFKMEGMGNFSTWKGSVSAAYTWKGFRELFDLEGVGVGSLHLEGVSWKTRDFFDRYLRNVRNVSAIGTVHRQVSANLLRIVDEGQTYYPETLFLALTYFRRALAQEIFKLRKKLCFWSSGGAIFFKLRVKFCFRSLGGAISGTEGWGGSERKTKSSAFGR